MPSRQRRLDTSYFSQPSSSQGDRRPKPPSRVERQGPASEDEDSEGSAGMAAIRLSESPKKTKSSEQQSHDVLDVDDSDDDDVQPLSPGEKGKEKGKSAETIRVTEQEPVSEQDDRTLVEGELDEVDAVDQRDGLEASGDQGREASVSSDSVIEFAPPPENSSSNLPRKRVSLSSATRQPIVVNGRGPMPKLPKRPQTVSEKADPIQDSRPNRKVVPYVELESWPTSRKALYRVPTPSNDRRSTSMSATVLQAGSNERRHMADIPEVSDDEILAITSPPPQAGPSKQPVMAVELPSSQRRNGNTEFARPPSAKATTATGISSKKVKTTDRDSAISARRRNEGSGRHFTPISGTESDDGADDDAPLVRKVDKGKAKAKTHLTSREASAREQDVQDSDASDRPLPRTQGSKKAKQKAPPVRSPPRSAKKRRVSISSDEREAMLSEIKMDEPKRFKSQSRLRKKGETAFQRKLRKLKEKRQGIIGSDTDTDEDNSDEDEDEDEETSDSAPDSMEEDFIEEDDGVVAEGMLPHEFSLNSAQTPEWKFKVVFHYFVLLVVEGTDILPLKGPMKEYMVPQLEDLRRKNEDFRDQRVRSQIWPHSLVNALKAYPEIYIASLDYPEEHCVACNRSNFKSRFRVELKGDKYDRDTYESKIKRRQRVREEKAEAKAKAKKSNFRRSPASVSGSDESSDSDGESETDEDEGELEYNLGAHCKKRTHVYHQMSHWERSLYLRIKNWYHDLLRANNQEISDDSEASSNDTDDDEDAAAKYERRQQRDAKRDETRRRVKRLKGQGKIPKEYGNVDVVTDWMDSQGHILNELKWMQDLQEQARRLEFDKSKDE